MDPSLLCALVASVLALVTTVFAARTAPDHDAPPRAPAGWAGLLREDRELIEAHFACAYRRRKERWRRLALALAVLWFLVYLASAVVMVIHHLPYQWVPNAVVAMAFGAVLPLGRCREADARAYGVAYADILAGLPAGDGPPDLTWWGTLRRRDAFVAAYGSAVGLGADRLPPEWWA